MKRFHKYLGLLMLLPIIAWAATGVFFFFKPGYQAAYQPLTVKLYPLTNLHDIKVQQNWLEVRQVKSILGDHLLVKTEQGWQQLSLADQSEIIEPTNEQVSLLVNDAIESDLNRYGAIKSIDKHTITTTTDVTITFNWQQMTLRQQGRDTALINNIYNIHYLRWTGIKVLDQFLGVIGLFLVVVLAVLGTIMTLKKKK